ncbi:aminotransferase class V-fold PLP-dependent enzyme [Streptomyces sp. NBC_00536]|uniref:pyridoxal phosphate-dependent decarboxylase family protein n=1 Tax=Streptomyces sp. NBC_00536 TaxID=2975769 RepID=UPI002E7FC6B3|nr:pyridoxal-dependent decarboxylase [Streptomyces sp. NBC_00536]WUC78482.1 aminotransferase class V-fold PLP-dependent enzyme [Streptomyces sp. NBC_00536]
MTTRTTPPHGTPPPLPPLAGGSGGADALRPLLDTVLDALTTGAAARGGPLPAGGPDAVAARVSAALGDVLPAHGHGDHEALRTLVHTLAAGAADPADPLCAAHLHGPPLAVAAAADLAASALNPSLDSWDQAPAASVIEALLTRALAAELYDTPRPDALVTTGGTEANQLALLLARERHRDEGPLTVLHGANAHHSVPRSAWLLGLPPATAIPTPSGTLHPADLDAALTRAARTRPGPVLVTATAGTTDAGLIDPLDALADVCERRGADLHVDAAYGGTLALSPRHRPLLHGLGRARSITLDLHKLGWQPVAAGLLAVPDSALLAPLAHQADYLNATDDTEAGLPDLLGRSLRTTRRPDILKIAVTLRSLGRDGLARLIDGTCDAARQLARLIDAHPGFELHAPPTISTVLFRPVPTDDARLAGIRRTLLLEGRAVLGRATADGRFWLKATLLNPHTTTGDLATLLTLLEGSTHR